MGLTVDGSSVNSPMWSFDDVYDEQYVKLCRLAGVILSDFHAGEEIAQEAFARLLVARNRIDDPVRYLHSTVVNLSRSRIRRAIVARRTCFTPGNVGDPANVAIGSDTRDRIQVALSHLSIRQRQAVALRYYNEMTEVEIADLLNISVSSVKTYLRRATMFLAKELEELL